MFAYCLNNPIIFSDQTGCRAGSVPIESYDSGGTCGRGYSIPVGNLYSFDKEYLVKETGQPKIQKIQTAYDAAVWINTISEDDFSDQLALNPLIGLPDWLSVLLDALSISQEVHSPGYIDPNGRPLYIEIGYTIIMYDRVYSGKKYTATETEYFILNKKYEVIFNKVIRTSYIVE